ncbi:MAG: sporulation protein [Bacteroidetes bacterium]|nr:sporulation protein [Bacteroidota bacterium]
MGFLSKLKSTITGSWADVTLSVASAQRGETAAVTVDVAVKSEPIRINRVYVQFRCTEEVKILNYQTGRRDAEGKTIVIDVRKTERLLNEEIVLAGAQELAAESHHHFEGELRIPAHLPASFEGRHASISWSAMAGLDMKGNDPDSGWQDLEIR